jgi:hypothetical protein
MVDRMANFLNLVFLAQLWIRMLTWGFPVDVSYLACLEMLVHLAAHCCETPNLATRVIMKGPCDQHGCGRKLPSTFDFFTFI